MPDLSPTWTAFIAQAIASGRFATEREVIEEALRLLERREAATEALRAEIQAAIDEDDWRDSDDVDAAINALADDLAKGEAA